MATLMVLIVFILLVHDFLSISYPQVWPESYACLVITIYQVSTQHMRVVPPTGPGSSEALTRLPHTTNVIKIAMKEIVCMVENMSN